MSTRSTIGYQDSDGNFIGVYCHFDGYPSNILSKLEGLSYDTVVSEVERALVEAGGRSLKDDGFETYRDMRGETSDREEWINTKFPASFEDTSTEFTYMKLSDGSVEAINNVNGEVVQ